MWRRFLVPGQRLFVLLDAGGGRFWPDKGKREHNEEYTGVRRGRG